jgi:uncharacterized delta-60 repeat protein
MRLIRSILAVSLTIAAAAAHAQAIDGGPDASFGGGSAQNVIAFDRGGGNSDSVRAMLVDSSDRIYLVGDVDTANGRRIGVARLVATGGADDSYGADGNGRVVAPVGGTAINVGGAAFDNDGYLIAVGSRVANVTNTDFLACRFNPQGVLTPFAGSPNACVEIPFDIGGLGADAASSVMVQADGKIVLAGRAETASSRTMAFARLLPDGTLDPDFGTGGKTTYTGATYVAFSAAAIHPLPDGSMIVAGEGVDSNFAQFGILVHLGHDGDVDLAFSGNHGYARSTSLNIVFTDVVFDSMRQQLIGIGNHAAGGMSGFIQCHGMIGDLRSCLNGSSSTLDNTLGANLWFNAARIDASGNLLIAGRIQQNNPGPTDVIVLRYTRTLELDSEEFAAPQGYSTHDYALAGAQDDGSALALQSNRILVAGASLRTANGTNYDFSVSGYAMDRIFQHGFEK